MALIRITPLEVRVRCDRFDGRPRRIRIGAEDIPVLTIERVRRERAAYPAEVGPRTRFEVLTPASRLELTFRHRDRRWLVEALDQGVTFRPSA